MMKVMVEVESLNQSSELEKKMAKMFAVIGDPINHSLSPNIHSAAFIISIGFLVCSICSN